MLKSTVKVPRQEAAAPLPTADSELSHVTLHLTLLSSLLVTLLLSAWKIAEKGVWSLT